MSTSKPSINLKTEQEAFWKGDFGDNYRQRNRGPNFIATNSAFFSKALEGAQKIQRILELGCNIGLNLASLQHLLPSADLSAVEINEKSADEAKQLVPNLDLHVGSILDFKPESTWDLVFTKGVLIHIDPESLSIVYDLMHRATSRYLLIGEYYNPKPVEITYRGYAGKLFKRDFAGEMLDRFSDLSLVRYGFVYHRDPNFPQGDMNWFLMEKIT